MSVERPVARARDVSIERLDGAARDGARNRVVVEEALELRARGRGVATILRTPGADLELVRGLLHAEFIDLRSASGAAAHPASAGLADLRSASGAAAHPASAGLADLRSASGAAAHPASAGLAMAGANVVDIDVDASAFAGRGLLATAACGVCGRVAIADLERRAREVASDARIARDVLYALPAALRAAQDVFDDTGGLHAAGLFQLDGTLVVAREDVGRHNAVDKVVGWALGAGVDPARHAMFLSGRAGYELVQKAIAFGVPIVGAVSAPSSLAVDLAERFNITLAGFVRGSRANLYAHAWRVT